MKSKADYMSTLKARTRAKKDPAGCMALEVVVKVTHCVFSDPWLRSTDVRGSACGLEKDQVLGSEGIGVVDSVGADTYRN
ncbi:hypothetical protein PsorP6_001490 [Peronosclerospora sorghi]|uniref:Uncharacterized protein n=1 Tax=Peronosclerospora sorghi TaxID=230839 RepID=A0ACC0WVS1_9STRA|nr:hypothetical protein PsorP6_001490 [Peronosclerospora sorghi]